jgi:hypothetical protein
VPFISDTGILAPESAIFTYFFNIGSLLVAITVLIHNKIISNKCNNQTGITSPTRTIQLCNSLSLFCGLMTAIGLTIIGNFRSSEMNATHHFGTYITCIFGTFHIILQSKIAYSNNYIKISNLRLIIVLIIIPSFLGYIFANFINSKMYNNVNFKDSLSLYISVICEWIGFCMFGPFYATFIPEFREIKSYKIVLIHKLSDEKIVHCLMPRIKKNTFEVTII